MTHCASCYGEGVVHTGIEESPTNLCSACDGSGHQLCEHGNDAECCQQCADEAQYELDCRYAEYYGSVL